MCIQRKKAEEKSIEFYVEYININQASENDNYERNSYSPIIKTDE